jgi:hypothetical protein
MPPLIDLTGRRFGKLTVIRRANGNGRPIWACRCDCGGTATVSGAALRSRHTRSCGCLGGKFIDLTGRTFGRLTVSKRLPSRGWVTMWRCRCVCRRTCDAAAGSLRSGQTRSCGCLAQERRSTARLIDMTGMVFGRLKVIKRTANRSGRVAWLCECSCGTDIVATTKHLRNKDTQSCGCLQKDRASAARLNDLTGRRFGRLVVVGRAEGGKHTIWLCKCDCGRVKTVAAQHLLSGAIRSCDCLRAEASRARRGASHPSWRPDLSEGERARKRNVNRNREWRYAVYGRDEYTCQGCGARGGPIEAHHLDAYNKYRRKRFLVSNGATLCASCHEEFHAKYGRGDNTAAQFRAFKASLRRSTATAGTPSVRAKRRAGRGLSCQKGGVV